MKKKNWIHLDLKGIIPSPEEMLLWIDWLADAGFDGIVFEYEDRLDWHSLPNTFRNGYTNEEWQSIWQKCSNRSLEVIPLAQTIGHLEWLLKHESFHRFRECDLIDEICPSNLQARELISNWINEIIALHPDIQYLHLGGDEVWHMGSCKHCKEKIASEEDGKVALYLEHISPLIIQVLEHGITPLIWADMFWPEERQHLAAKLPDGVILVDWQYGWQGPKEVTQGLVNNNSSVWAASAVRCAYDMTQALPPLRQRIQNVEIWNKQLAEDAIPGVIHTCWSRASSFRPLYGPIEGILPLLIYAANSEKGKAHPLFKFIDRVDLAVYSELLSDTEIEELRKEIKETAKILPHEFEQRCCQWWDFAIEYANLRNKALKLPALLREQNITESYTEKDWHVGNNLSKSKSKVAIDLLDWQTRAMAFWNQCGLSDGEEFFASRSGVLNSLL